ncbi:hypothetical protein ACFV1L_10895 [Kitasatospora sp. NPDC059646]|uniref:hypothetical protein n=1 Tax=Kitasatospora sp. NPDC059646 TaxID=3346893 RepID=UPI0036A251E7
MRLTDNGTVAASRLVLADGLETDDGFAFVPVRPLFLAVGDRVELTGPRPVVVRADGARRPLDGDWETRCRGGVRRRW